MAQVALQGELCPGVAAELDHAHTRFILPNLKGAGHRRDEAADVLEVGPANAPGTIHQKHHVGHGAQRAFWEKGRSRREEGNKKMNVQHGDM